MVAPLTKLCKASKAQNRNNSTCNTIIHMDLPGDSSTFGFPTHLMSAAVNVLDPGGNAGVGILYDTTGQSAISGKVVCREGNHRRV